MNDDVRVRDDLHDLLRRWGQQYDTYMKKVDEPEPGDDWEVDETIADVLAGCMRDLRQVLDKPPQHEVDASTDAYAEDFTDALWHAADGDMTRWNMLRQAPDPVRLMYGLVRRFFQTHRHGYIGALFDVIDFCEDLLFHGDRPSRKTHF